MTATFVDPAAVPRTGAFSDGSPASTERWNLSLGSAAVAALDEGPRREFLTRLLSKLCETGPAKAAAVWSVDPQGVVALEAECQFASTGISRDPGLSRNNLKSLLDVLHRRETAGGTSPGGTHVPHGAILAPLLIRDRCLGVLQLFLEESPSAESASADRLAAEELAGLVAWSLDWRDEQAALAGQLAFYQQLTTVLRALQSAGDTRHLAGTAVNAALPLLKADRLTLVLGPASRAQVVAVTGQETVNPRGDQAVGLMQLGRLALQTGRTLDSQIPAEQWPTAIRTPLLQHLRDSGARSVRVLPLFGTARPTEGGATPADNRTGSGVTPAARESAPPRAALIVEQFQAAWTAPPEQRRQQLFADHLGALLQRTLETESIWLLPTRRAVGRLTRMLWGTTGRRWCAGLLLALGVIATLAVQPATCRVEARGRLQPATGRSLFAPRDAEVTAVLVAGGERVEAGQPLVRLHDHQLESELLAARNRVLEKQQQADAQQAEIDELARRGNRPDELLRLRGRLVQSQSERRAASERVASLETEADRLTIRAPLAGTIASFEPGRELQHRPVRRGERLLEVLDESGPWRLELQIAETQVGLLRAARRRAPQPNLPVEYVLATNPEARHQAELDQVATRTSVSPDRGSVLEVTAAVDEVPAAPMGTEVVAKIDCGRESLLFVLFGDLYHLALRTVW